MRRVFALLLCACLLAGCGAPKSWRKGGVRGTKPYTVLGKTYYPLQSAHGFVEEGVASWYGPGFHGKPTASGEPYNQYAMTAAHKILPLGTKVSVTHLENGKSVVVRINDRGPFVDDRVIDLSKTAATQLGLTGKGTGRVRIASVGDIPLPRGETELSEGDFYIQLGAFGNKANAARLIGVLEKSGYYGRLIFGGNNMWNVQAGPWKGEEAAQKILEPLRALYPGAFVIKGN